MLSVYQHNASGCGKLGVASDYLNNPRHNVLDCLAGAVVADSQLKVGNGIIKFITILVVNGFASVKGSAKMFFHNISVFKNLSFLPGFVSKSRNGNPYIPVLFDVFGINSICKLARAVYASKFRATFRAANLLLSVNGSPRSPLYGHGFIANDAIHLPTIIGKFFGVSHAAHRAVVRVTPELLEQMLRGFRARG